VFTLKSEETDKDLSELFKMSTKVHTLSELMTFSRWMETRKESVSLSET